MTTSREKLATLHDLLIDDVLGRIQSGEATRDDKRLALDLCKNSNISAVAVSGSTIHRLVSQVDFGDTSERVVPLRANG